MKVVTPGVEYQVQDFKGTGMQTIRFNHKERDGSYLNGTTVEELLSVLLHKLKDFQKRSPSEFNAASIEHLQHIRGEFYARLQEKKKINHDDPLPTSQ